MGSLSRMINMAGYLYWIVSAFVCNIALSDYHQDYSSYNNYYPDYSYNFSSPTYATRQKRIFDEELNLAMSFSFNFDAAIPLDDLSSAIYISIPFSFSLPSGASSKTDYGQGRSLGGVADVPTRALMYKHLEGYVSQITGSDGHACLLRAMCETSASPLHDDGILGDAINFLLTGSYSAADAKATDKTYFEAQAKGQLSGDCSSYHSSCPVSFFKYLG